MLAGQYYQLCLMYALATPYGYHGYLFGYLATVLLTFAKAAKDNNRTGCGASRAFQHPTLSASYPLQHPSLILALL